MSLGSPFQLVTQEDLDELAGKKVTRPGDKPLAFFGIVGLREMENTQKGAVVALAQAIAAREAEIAAVNADNTYSAAFKSERVEKIQAKHDAAIDAAVTTINGLAQDAETQTPFWTRPASLQRCTFVKDPAKDAAIDAAIRSDLARRLSRMPATGLIDVARLALAQAGEDRAKSAATVACLSEEIDYRFLRPELALSRENVNELVRLMSPVNAFDLEARQIIATMTLTARESILLGRDRRGDSTLRIANGLQRQAVEAMPSA